MKLQKTRVPSNFSKFAILRVLGLPRNARWKDAADLLKYRIVRARAEGNDRDASVWSEAKAVLKRNLKRDCIECGRAIRPKSRHCRTCSPAITHRRKSQPKTPAKEKFLKIDWDSLAVESRFQTNPIVKSSRISLGHLRKLFKAHHGVPVAKWLSDRRQKWIADNILLLPLGETINGSGLSMKSFYRVFTRDFGMPPVAYMQGGYAKAA